MQEKTIVVTRDGIKSQVAKYLNIDTHFSVEKEEELWSQIKPASCHGLVESGVFVHSYDGNMAKGSYRSQKIRRNFVDLPDEISSVENSSFNENEW